VAELAAIRLRESPPDPSTINPAGPPELSRIILRALAAEPRHRWQSAGELLRALETI